MTKASPPLSEAEFNFSLGLKLKSLRKACGISQDYLGEFLGVHQTAVCRIENGEQTMTPQQLHQVSMLFGLKIDDLIQNHELKYELIAKRMSRKTGSK